jgi:beta-galactosidase
MYTQVLILAALVTAASCAFAKTESFDENWRFAKGDIAGAEQLQTADTAWEVVNVPHDWAAAGPFDQNAASTGSGGWLPTGVVWYRKHFVPADADKGKRIFVEFDGVMDRSGVWINGMHVGHRPNGYSSFRYEITPHLKYGENNVLSVRADTSAQPASRWYAGGGIYRHVRLITTGDIHVDTHGSFVTTPQLDSKSARVKVESAIINQSTQNRTGYLDVTILDQKGKQVAKTKGAVGNLPAGRVTKLSADTLLKNPVRWDIKNPALHQAVIRVLSDSGEVLDTDTITFGVREMKFEAATGFWLNGKNIKLKGAAIHADGGAFGMAVPLSFYERRLRGLQMLGVNAIRTAHHPFSPEFLDLCDRMGILVMNEAFDMWTVAKNPQDYHLFFTDWSSIDARDFVKRDRNHPSVFIWSIGNEIHDTPYPVVAKSIVARLKNIFHEEDPSRPITQALFRPNTTGDYQNGLADMLDVVGQNYRENELAKAHADNPARKIIGTENSKNRASWLVVRDNPAYAGMFLWTGADYLGEADRAGWPFISNPSGLVDRTDVVKPIGWERAAWWSEKPVVKIMRRVTEVIDTSELPTMVGVALPQPKGPGVLADWTPENIGSHIEKVEVVSNTQEVELFLNNKSLGRKAINKDDSARSWDVTFASGTIKAIGYNKGKPVAEDELQTAGKATSVKLIAEQKTITQNFDSIGYVRVEILDDKGVLVPNANVPLTVEISGAGNVVAFDNGDPADYTSFVSTKRKSWNGRALVMVRASDTSGEIKLTVKGESLRSANISLKVNPK